MYTVDLQDCIDKMDLECLTPDVDISQIKITQSDINRPALQLAGFFDYFDHHRVQIIGHVENTFLSVSLDLTTFSPIGYGRCCQLCNTRPTQTY